MYAIVEIAGKQYKVAENSVIDVDKMEITDKQVNFDKILLLVSGEEIKVGAPTVPNVKITAEIVNPKVKGDKVVVFKWKRRKNMRRKKGHRQQFTKIKIQKIEG
jgi:large subunit ribosomal protein L21